MSIQEMINDARAGDTVKVPVGQYNVDSIGAPITLKSGLTLDLSEATIIADPVDSRTEQGGQRSYDIVRISGCENIVVKAGTIIGESDRHIGPTNSEVGGFGMGIGIRDGSRDVKVLGTQISKCFADGIYIHDAYNVEVSHAVLDKNRRQGMSVIQVDGLVVTDSQFSNTGGTIPGDGIDFECDNDSQYIRNVLVSRNVFFGNQGASIAFGSPGQYSKIQVTGDNDFDMVTQPIWVGGNAGPLGTPWYAFVLNRTLGWLPNYRYWGYRRNWSKA